jgi:hypothetical protein
MVFLTRQILWRFTHKGMMPGWIVWFMTMPQHVPNPGYSLFNDTASYFVTIGDEFGLRIGQSNAVNYADFLPQNYCRHTVTKEFHQKYLVGREDINGISLPSYDEAEGWFDNMFGQGGSHTTTLNTEKVYEGNDASSSPSSLHFRQRIYRRWFSKSPSAGGLGKSIST